MKSTGSIRRVDGMGRIVLPKELRDNLNLKTQDPIEIYVDHNNLVMKKHRHENACFITGELSDKNTSFFEGKIVLSKIGAKILNKELNYFLK